MNYFFTVLMNGWLENEQWISRLTPREPVIYIAAGVLGILLFIGFIASIIAIVFAIKHQTKASNKSHAQMYRTEKNEAAQMVISALRESEMTEQEIRDILISQFSFDALSVDSLLAASNKQ